MGLLGFGLVRVTVEAKNVAAWLISLDLIGGMAIKDYLKDLFKVDTHGTAVKKSKNINVKPCQGIGFFLLR